MSHPYPSQPQVLALDRCPTTAIRHGAGWNGRLRTRRSGRHSPSGASYECRPDEYHSDNVICACADVQRELSQNGPFWPAAIMRFSAPLALLGNEVLVAALPRQIPFHLYTIICAREPVSCAWDVIGPSGGDGNSQVLAHAEEIIKPALLEHAADPATGGVPGTGAAPTDAPSLHS